MKLTAKELSMALASLVTFGAIYGLISAHHSLSTEKVALSTENDRLKAQLSEVAKRLQAMDAGIVEAFDQTKHVDSLSVALLEEITNRSRLNLAEQETMRDAFASEVLVPPRRALGGEEGFAKLIDVLGRVQQNILTLNHKVDGLGKTLLSRRDILTSIPLMLPAEGRISSRFGQRLSPTAGKDMQHKGMDIAGGIGRQIFAPADGEIRYSGNFGGFGRYISIEHGNGFVTKYAHLEDLFVKKGQSIRRGDLIGTIGNTGRTTGPHLHYEVWFNDLAVDPERLIVEGLKARFVGPDEVASVAKNTSL